MRKRDIAQELGFRDEPKQPDSDWVYCVITVLMVWAIMHCVAIGWFGG